MDNQNSEELKVPYVIKHIKYILNRINESGDPHKDAVYIRNQLPYTLHDNNDGTVTPLNRDYKPLGVLNISEHVDYSTVTLYNIDASLLDYDKSKPYLYSDQSNPRLKKTYYNKYVQHLEKIFRLSTYGG